MMGWQYKLMNLTSLDVGVFRGFYEGMPKDPYMGGEFRTRRHSSVQKTSEGNYKVLPHTTFTQSYDVNKLVGEVERTFEPLDEKLATSVNFAKVVDAFAEMSGFDATEAEIGIHQVRVKCAKDIEGDPAPEGRHQDGFKYIGIFVVERHNIEGGFSELYLTRDPEEKPFMEKILEEHEMLIVNDQEIFHNASGITPTADEGGYRDVFVLTA
jgi:hypothetical protein